jgi:ribose-phosphate pyrophosphokinase
MEEKLNQEELDTIFIAGGFGNPELTENIAESMGAEVGPIKQKLHPDGEIYVRYLESLRGKDVFVIQSHVRSEFNGVKTSVNDAAIQQFLLIDAAKPASARSVTAVLPYMSYGRQDRKTKGREPIGTRMMIRRLAASPLDRIVTVDMHSGQAQGIFDFAFDHLTAQPLLRDAVIEEVSDYDRDECIIVSPDAGAVKRAEDHQAALDMGMFVMPKSRDKNDSEKIRRQQDKFPEADGRVCLVFDDMIDTAGTIVTAAEVLVNSGAKAVFVAATHGVLSGPAVERLKDAPIEKIIVTDTFRTHEAQEQLGDKLRVVSAAPTIARAIVEIVRCGSISELFNDQNNS